MLRIGTGRLAQLGKPPLLVGAGVPLPAPLTGAVARWDAYSGIVADTTNGGYKWNPVTGSSDLVSISGTGPDYSATGLSGRPAMQLSTGKSLVTSPAVSLVSGNLWFFIAFQMAAPATFAELIGNTASGGTPLIRVNADGGLSVIRANQAIIASVAAGAVPFGQRVLLSYLYNNGATVKHVVRINKVLQTTVNDTNGGAYATGANALAIGRQTATSSSTDAIAQISYFEAGSVTAPPTGTTLTDYEAALYNRWIA